MYAEEDCPSVMFGVWCPSAKTVLALDADEVDIARLGGGGKVWST